MTQLTEEIPDRTVREAFKTALCQSFLEPLTVALGSYSRNEQSRRSGVPDKTLERWFSEKADGWKSKSDVAGAKLAGIASLVAAFNAQYDGHSGVDNALSAYRAAIQAIDSELEPTDLAILCAVMLFQRGRVMEEPDAMRWVEDVKAAFVDDLRRICELLYIDDSSLGDGEFFAAALSTAIPLLQPVAIITDATHTTDWFAEDILDDESERIGERDG